jgi:tRNA (guanine-N7-)-methyltransferase
MTTPPSRLIPSYGRRRGRPLRATRAALMDEVLPRLTIAAPSGTLDPATLFATRPRELWLEIGFGGGEHLAHQAETHRDIGFIGAEPYLNGVAGLLARIDRNGIDNIRLWPGDVRALLPAISPHTFSYVFVLFPDPWPKARHHKRRLIVAELIAELARVMRPGGELRIATDDLDYLAHIREVMAAQTDFTALGQGRPDDAPKTRYESKAEAAGRQGVYLRFARRAGPGNGP